MGTETPGSDALEALSGRADGGTGRSNASARTGTRSKAGSPAAAPRGGAESAADAEALLRSLDVVTVIESGRLRLEPGFRRAWRDRTVDIRERNAQLEALARRLEVAPGRVALAVTSDGFVATRDRTRIGCWPSNAAFLADLAAASVLERENDAGWRAFDEPERSAALTALRLFLERCPNCDGAIVEADSSAVRIGEPAGRSLDGESAAGPTVDSTGTVALECDCCGVMVIREPYA